MAYTVQSALLFLLLAVHQHHGVTSQCVVPNAPDRGVVTPDPGTLVEVGSKMTYICENSTFIDPYDDYEDYDYDLHGHWYKTDTQSRTCQEDGSWDGVDLVECYPFECEVEPLEHGRRIPEKESYLSGDVITVECDEGYGAVGPTELFCDLKYDGWHDAEETTCKKIFCPRPYLKNGERNPDQTKYYPSESVHLSCNEGYMLKGPEKMTCTETYGWYTRETPLCVPQFAREGRGCPEVGVLPGTDEVRTDNPNRMRQYKCQDDLEMEGPEIITCNRRTKQWSSDPPFCRTLFSFDPIPVLADRLVNTMKDLTSNRIEGSEVSRRKKRAFHDIANKPLTLYFLVDQSGSIKKRDIEYIRKFILEMVKQVEVRDFSVYLKNDTNSTAARFGLVHFADVAKTSFVPYSSTQNMENIRQAVHANVTFQSKKATNLQAGLEQVISAIEVGNGIPNEKWQTHLEQSNKAVIIITDGKYNEGGKPEEHITKLREVLKYKTYAIGVQASTKSKSLRALVDPKKRHEDIYLISGFLSYKLLVVEMLKIADVNYCGMSPMMNKDTCSQETYHLKGGNNSNIENFPWTVEIYYLKDNTPTQIENIKVEGRSGLKFQYKVGHGALVSRNMVLTAAHLMYKDTSAIKNETSRFLVVLGDGEVWTVTDIHERGYKKFNGNLCSAAEKDIMLLELDYGLHFNKKVKTLCLPGEVEGVQEFIPENVDIGDGYVAVVQYDEDGNDGLHEACLTERSCTVDGNVKPRIQNGDQDIYCAGSGKTADDDLVDTEGKDSGSVTVNLREDADDALDKRYVAQGITAFNADPTPTADGSCSNEASGLGAYVKVIFHMDWIKQVLIDNASKSSDSD